MTIREILNLATKKLQNKSTSASLDAEVLLAFVLKRPKEYLLINAESRIENQKSKKFITLIKKRATGWPVAYLTHHKEFFGLDFYVDKNVLIPRSETEMLVEMALKRIENQESRIKILDIGTGSGCVIISIAKSLFAYSRELDHIYFASDISSAALRVAKRNARIHKTRISFIQSNILRGWQNQHFDIIVANLPYLAKKTDRSTKFEPKQALVAKKQGLALYEKLFKQVSPLTPLPSTLLLEFDPRQTTQIKKLAKQYLPGYSVKIHPDLAGLNRLAILARQMPALGTSMVRPIGKKQPYKY